MVTWSSTPLLEELIEKKLLVSRVSGDDSVPDGLDEVVVAGHLRGDDGELSPRVALQQ